MVEPLVRDFASLRHGDHICLPYDDGDECSQVVVPFLAEGLARGERCVYVVADARRDELLQLLAGAGINASRAIERGALCLFNAGELYFRNGRGRFDVDETLALIETLLAGALAEGFTGVRGSGEVTAADWEGIPWQTLLAYEARFNEQFGGRPVVALCRYHRDQWPANMVGHALRTHPKAIVGGRLCRNPYYEKPDIALAPDQDSQDAARVEWMLRQLRWSAAAEERALQVTRSLADETARLAAESQSRARGAEELERAVRLRDRFLDDLSKELAGPVGGLSAELAALAAQGPKPGANHGAVHGVGLDRPALRGHLRRLGALVEKLNEVSHLTNRRAGAGQQEGACQQLDEIDLADVARQVTLRHRDRLAALGSTVSFRATEARILGRWDRRRLEQLVANLLANAARRGAGHPIDLELGCEGAAALLSVRYQGRPLPQANYNDNNNDNNNDNDSDDDDEATAFEQDVRAFRDDPHAAWGNAGIWVAREIAAGFGGSLSISADQPAFTTLTAELPRRPRSLGS